MREAVQARNALAVDTSEGSKQRGPPLLVKIAPDLDEQELKDIAEIVMENGVDGVIISNTTVSRPESLKSGGRRVDEIGFRFSSSIHSFAATLAAEAGGLSGRPLKPLSLTMVARFYKLTGGRMPIVGCGGITTGADAVDFIEAGASFVQVYSGFAYQGPGLVRDIKDELEKACRKRGVSNVRELVGRRAVDLAKS